MVPRHMDERATRLTSPAAQTLRPQMGTGPPSPASGSLTALPPSRFFAQVLCRLAPGGPRELPALALGVLLAHRPDTVAPIPFSEPRLRALCPPSWNAKPRLILGKSFQIAHDKFVFSFWDDLLLSGLGVVLGTYGLWVLTLQEPELLEEEGPCL